MNVEEQLISAFYTNFQQRDCSGMLECYHPDVFFYDPVFGNLEGGQVRAMWMMLLAGAHDLEVRYSLIQGGEGYGSCTWSASYTYPPTRRKVINRGKAHFACCDGKITEHHDDFNLWRWSAQALGIKGLLFGWTSVFQKELRRRARVQLERYIIRKMN